MEPHGKNPTKSIVAVIPARYASSRLPGKLLLDIAGKPLILHTLTQTQKASTVTDVIVATDDERICTAVRAAGAECVMTSREHESGSDRVAEVARGLPDHSIVVNVQGDEPLISPDTIDSAVRALLDDEAADMSTTFEPIRSVDDELLNGNVVKVVVGDNGYAVHFSRSPMPFPREAAMRYGGDPGQAIRSEPDLLRIFKKHTGLYAYRREYLLKFTSLPPTTLEKVEMLEQLRALENGARIRVVESAGSSIGVDTQEDLDNVRLKLEFPEVRIRAGNSADVGAVSQLYLNTVRGSYTDILPDDHLNGLSIEGRGETLNERMGDESYHFLVAEHESSGIVASIDFRRMESGNYGFDGRIISFYVATEFQGRGLGTLLFRQCLRQMRRSGYRSVCLDTFEANKFRRFYEKMNGELVASSGHAVGALQLPTVVYGWSDISKV